MRVFAYGSNLNRRQMLRRCPQARVVGPAVAPNAALRFRAHWLRRLGAQGVADIEDVPGEVLLGAVYDLPASDLVALDRAEGVPRIYRRQTRTVVLAGRGARVAEQAWCYRLVAPGPCSAPQQHYLGQVARGYLDHDLDLLCLVEAVDETPGPRARIRLWVYGSLLPGLGNAGYLRTAQMIGPATTAESTWTMIDMGGFPGMVSGGSGRVRGALYRADAATVRRIDHLEGHPRFYRRTWIQVQLDRGAEIGAYAYVLRDRRWHAPRAIVPDGDWRRYHEARLEAG